MALAQGMYNSVAEVKRYDWPWEHFKPEEVACKGSGKLLVIPTFLDLMETLRTRHGAPISINSWYRSPEHNSKVSSTGKNGPHTTGRAVDVAMLNPHRFRLMRIAMDLGFTGIGVAKTFIHLDYGLELTHPRPSVWTY